MPMLFRIPISASVALSVVLACAMEAPAFALVSAPLFIGPDRLGSAVTYRLTMSAGPAGSAPNVQTVALRWKLGQKLVVTLTSADDAQPTPLVATRAADGTLTLDNVSDDSEGQRIAVAIGVLNRLDGFVAAAPAGAKTWKTTLVVQPLAAAAPAPDAPVVKSSQAPQSLNIPVAGTRSDDAAGTTLAASGSIDRTVTRPTGDSSPRGGGGMGRRGGGGMGGGGGRMGGGSFGSSSGPKNIKVTTKITVAAHFGRDGQLTSATIVEANQAADDQNQTSTRSWKIERTL